MKYSWRQIVSSLVCHRSMKLRFAICTEIRDCKLWETGFGPDIQWNVTERERRGHTGSPRVVCERSGNSRPARNAPPAWLENAGDQRTHSSCCRGQKVTASCCGPREYTWRVSPATLRINGPIGEDVFLPWPVNLQGWAEFVGGPSDAPPLPPHPLLAKIKRLPWVPICEGR